MQYIDFPLTNQQSPSMIPQKKPVPQRRQQISTENDSEATSFDDEITPSSGNKKTTIFILCFVGAIAIGIGAYLLIKSNQKAKETEKAEDIARQIEEQVNLDFENYEEEMEAPATEEATEEALPEEILNVEKVTDIVVVDDYDKYSSKEIETATGTVSFDQGTEDLNIIREHKNEVTLDEPKPADVPEEKVFTSVEQMPQFPGGEGAMLKYLSEHVVYPPMAQENNVQGRVVVQFVIKKDGSIGDVKVVRSKDPDLDKEAVRVVKTFPKFTPGKMNGQPVDVWYTLPINFKLQW